MASISSINGNPIVVGTDGIEDGSITDAKFAASPFGGIAQTGTLPLAWVYGAISTSTGSESTSTSYMRTENAVEVVPDGVYALWHSWNTMWVNEYDSDKTWLRSLTFSASTKKSIYIPTDSTVAYVKLCGRKVSGGPANLPDGHEVGFAELTRNPYASTLGMGSPKILSADELAAMNIASVADFPPNKVWYVDGRANTGSIEDLPAVTTSGRSFMLFRILGSDDGQSSSMIFVYTATRNVLSVGHVNSAGVVSWSENHLRLEASGVAELPSTDMGEMYPLTINYVSPSWFSETGGLPATSAGWLLTLGSPASSYTSISYKMQVYMSNDHELFVRHNQRPTASSWTWSEWEQIGGGSAGGSNHWYGKTWYAYGTSMTEYVNKPLSNGEIANGYAAYLPDLSGMQLTNRGMGGSGIIPSRHGGESADNVKTRCMTLDDGKADADLITLEIGPNDGLRTQSAGSITDVYADDANNTFLGHLADILRYLQENTTATIVVLFTTYSRYETGNPSNQYTPESNATYKANIELAKQKCALYGVPVIDGFSNCQLGIYRVGYDDKTYVGDQIHLTAAGGYNLAQYFWSQLKDVPLFYTEAE